MQRRAGRGGAGGGPEGGCAAVAGPGGGGGRGGLALSSFLWAAGRDPLPAHDQLDREGEPGAGKPHAGICAGVTG